MTTVATTKQGEGGLGTTAIDDAGERWQRTAVAAFFLAEARGFAPGGELDDWLAAERDLASRASLPSVSVQPSPQSAPEGSRGAPARKRTVAAAGSRRRKSVPATGGDSGVSA